MQIKGIDISRAQENFDFEAAKKAGVKFIIIRAGIRTDKDSYFDKNLAACRKYGIPYGFYWYFEATDGKTFEKELNACVSVVKGQNPTYPCFFDMEEQKQIEMLTTKQRTDMAVTFCNTMKEIGIPYGIYANPSWLENYFDKARLINKYDIWLANWTYDPKIPSRYNYNQVMWQWGIEKIGGKDVDSNLCYKEYKSTNNNNKPTTNTIKKGDKVRVKSGAKTYDGGNLASWVYDAVFDVMEVSGDRIVIGIDGAVTAAVNSKDLIVVTTSAIKKPITTTTSKFKKGDKVRVVKKATAINGAKLAFWVYHTVFDVLAVNGKNITIGLKGKVTATLLDSKLYLANKKTNNSTKTNTKKVCKKGSTVMVKKNAKDYYGGTLSSWVYKTKFTVLELVGDRAVIGIDGAVTAAMNVKDLIVK